MAQNKQIEYTNWLQTCSIRLARIRYILLAIFAISIIIVDAWKLIEQDVVLQRWTVTGVALVANSILWYASRNVVKSSSYYKVLLFAQIVLDIGLASFTVYNQRGIASSAAILYALPIVTSAVLLSRSAIYATASIVTATYVMVVMRYAVLNPSENYRIQLYGDLFFYCGIFFVLAAMLHVLVKIRARA